jgi:parvulin-like peptidyl-prolyl isomerase
MWQAPSPLAAQTRSIPIDGYAAVVNDRVITVGEIMSIVKPVEEQLKIAYSGNDLEEKLNQAFDTALESLIDQALILEEFEKQGGDLPDRIVDEHVNRIINDRFEGNRQKLMEALAEDQLTYEEWRDSIRERLIVMILKRNEVSDRVSITPRTIREEYEERMGEYRLPEQVKLQVIVLYKPNDTAGAAIKIEEARSVHKRLLDGDDFGTVAQSLSEDGKAAQGGDWGWIEAKNLRPELQEALTVIKPGSISDIIATDQAFYILKVNARKSAGVVPFEKAKLDIEESLRRAESARIYSSWIARLRKKHYVKVY